MLNRFETIAGLEGRNRVAGRQSASKTVTSLSVLLSSINYKYMLLILITCLTGSLIATVAYSQELPAMQRPWSPQALQVDGGRPKRPNRKPHRSS
jgi:hypothetical protein